MDTRKLRNPPGMSILSRENLYRMMAEQIEQAANEIDTLRAALVAIEVYIADAEYHDPVIEDICRSALAGD